MSLTGRTIRLRWHGDIRGLMRRMGGTSGPGPGPPPTQEVLPLLTLTSGFGTLAFTRVGPYGPNLYKLQMSAQVATQSATVAEILPVGNLLSVDLNGTWEFVIETAEEVLTPSEAAEWPGYAYRRGVGGSPTDPLVHGLHWRDATLSLQRQLSTTATATLTVGGTTVSSSYSSASSIGGPGDYGIAAQASLYVGWGNAAFEVTCNSDFGGIVEDLGVPLGYSSGHYRLSAAHGWRMEFVGNPDSGTPGDHQLWAQVNGSLRPPQRVRLSGESALVQGTPISGSEYRWTAYGGPAVPEDPEAPPTRSVTVVSAGGSVSRTDILRKHSIAFRTGSGGTLVGGETIDEWQRTARVYGRKGWLAAGEDPSAWRCLLIGHKWPALTLQQGASRTVDDATPANWTAGANTTVGGSAGAMTLAVSGGAGSASRAFSPPENFEEFRYLRVRVKADAATKPLTVELGTKTWTVHTDGTADTYADLTLDLRSPHNASATSDGADTRYPLATDGLPAVGVDGPLSGVSRTTSLILSGLEDGVTYTLASVSLVRTLRSRASVMLPFGMAGSRWIGPPGSRFSSPDVPYTTLRFLTGETDGKPSLEAAGWLVRQDGGSTPDYPNILIPTLAELVEEITADCQAWAATLSGDEADGYHTSERPALLLAGSGAWYEDGAWGDARDLAAEGGLALPAVDLWDGITAWPGCGDFAGTGDFGETVFRFHHFLRGSACGVVLDGSSHEPATGVEVDALFGAESDGVGTSGALGWYETGPPGARAPQTITVKALAGASPPSLTVPMTTRRRRQAAFRVTRTGPGGGLDTDVSRAHRHLHAYTDSGAIWTGHATTVRGGGWLDTDSGISGDEPNIRALPDAAGTILLLYTASSAVKEQRSIDEGGAWTVATTIFAAGTHGRVIALPSLSLYYIAYDAGTIKARQFDLYGNEEIAETVIVASGVDDDTIDVRYVEIGGGVPLFIVSYRSSGALTEVRSPNGITGWV